ncbi:MAG: flagellar hook-basal body complex protein FliE [Spirochaetaceae bacterium]|jgi:flagellar hook-basal body complex protein FliE|nr:flagellar hook-basal body complex protein FliE [Spirochaetaceae bacterium]
MINAPRLIAVDRLPLQTTHPKHFESGVNNASTGKNIADTGKAVGADGVMRSGGFEDAMLRALDKVSGDQQEASNIMRAAITDPGSVNVHAITIAQAKASMSLNITRTVLNRLVQGWKDLINTR